MLIETAAVPLPVFLFDRNLNLLEANPAAQKLLPGSQRTTFDDCFNAGRLSCTFAEALAIKEVSVRPSKDVWGTSCHLYAGGSPDAGDAALCVMLLQPSRPKIWRPISFDAFRAGLGLSEEGAPPRRHSYSPKTLQEPHMDLGANLPTLPESPPPSPKEVEPAQTDVEERPESPPRGALGIGSLSDILENLEDARNPNIEMLRTIIRSIPQVVYTCTPGGTLNFINQQWMDLTGLSEEQAYELSNWFSLFHPDDLPAAVAGFSHAMQNAVPLHITYRIKRQDGEWIWHESRGNLVETAEGGKMWCCTVSDVEVMVRARQALEVQQARMTAVLDGAGILLFNVGSDLRVRFFEGRLPPFMPQETVFVDRLLRDVWPDPELEKAISQALAAPEAPYIFTTEIVIDGHSIFFKYHLQSEGVGVNVVALEVTELEAALRKSDEERQRLLASEMAANEASRFKSLFVSNVSHEIRTPIAIMLSCTELLLTESIAPEHRQLLEKSLDAAQFLLDLVSQVLDIGKIEGGQLTLDPRPFLLSSSAADVNLLILSKRPSDRVRFLDESQPVYRELVYGDAVRLKQILLNLLGNAVKFCLDGFISFSMMQESETDTLVNMLYVVRDTGIGISPEDAKKLFTPFRQAEASTHSKYGGSGLGLYVSKQLAELMGGSIALESAVGQGTTVSVRLPFLKAAPSRTASPAIVKPVYELPVPRHHIKILLAEDNEVLSTLVLAMLKKLGFRASAVANGAEAVHAVQNDTWSLLLLDQQMPVMDGLEAARRIRRSADTAKAQLPILALTASAIQGDEEICRAAGCTGYLTKPIHIRHLEAAILEQLHLAQQAQAQTGA